MQLGFVTETEAYDPSALCEFAHAQRGDGVHQKMLAMFLELDQPLRLKRQESGLQGIRKAQIKLACYYLAAGIVDRAARIAADMAGEDRERLRSIREQLARVESKSTGRPSIAAATSTTCRRARRTGAPHEPDRLMAHDALRILRRSRHRGAAPASRCEARMRLWRRTGERQRGTHGPGPSSPVISVKMEGSNVGGKRVSRQD